MEQRILNSDCEDYEDPMRAIGPKSKLHDREAKFGKKRSVMNIAIPKEIKPTPPPKRERLPDPPFISKRKNEAPPPPPRPMPPQK